MHFADKIDDNDDDWDDDDDDIYQDEMFADLAELFARR